MQRDPQFLIRTALGMGEPLSSAQLGMRSGVAQATAWRILSGPMATRVMRLGAGRGSRFALRHPISRHGSEWPVFAIDEAGTAREFCRLTALAGDNWHIEFARPEPLYGHGMRDGYCEGWPWFLANLMPDGWLGGIFAKRVARSIGAPGSLDLWGRDDFLLAALLYGADQPGNLIIGEHPLVPVEAVPDTEWPQQAVACAAGTTARPLSSPGGQRPKFVSGNEIVKFARRVDGEENRWADLLIAEYHAGQVLRDRGIAHAHTRIVESGGFVFHASLRFDRVGSHGRRAAHSLRAVDDGLIGAASGDWPLLAGRMRSEGLLDAASADTIGFLWEFGRLIGNTDMHTGNLAFHVAGDRMQLAPAYDMLPMRYAPVAGVLRCDPVLIAPEPQSAAAEAARDFWMRVTADPRIGSELRSVVRADDAGAGVRI